ncbi:MAG: tetratricopeptide repeat protein, partial [Deltaproteobacteria bacterium]|nr:tetratricopeptide repeat protein [Deltaproteobacteria bacterium]
PLFHVDGHDFGSDDHGLTHLNAISCLGVAQYHRELYSEAETAFEAVVELDSDSARAYYGLGLARLYQDDHEGAAAAYTALKGLDSELARDLFGRIYPPEGP